MFNDVKFLRVRASIGIVDAFIKEFGGKTTLQEVQQKLIAQRDDLILNH